MPNDYILQSIKLDPTASVCGFPHFARGKQPRFPEVSSETAKLSSSSIAELLAQLNQIYIVSFDFFQIC